MHGTFPVTIPTRMMAGIGEARKALAVAALRRSLRRASLPLVCATLLAGPATAETAEPLRVMSFNIEWGGTHVSFAQVVAAIRAADPDVVAVQEAEGNLARLAGELGWEQHPAHHVVSRFPLIEPDADPRWLWVETRPGYGVALANVHLPSDPYGEDLVRAGRPAGEVLALERRLRLPAIRPYIDALAPLVAAGVPVIVAGDFNAPSHLDWTKSALERWPERRYALTWPVSLALAEAGFRDAWRSRHPDVVTAPGFTWWAARPRIADYNPGPGSDWQSRIDAVHVAGAVQVADVRIVGERGAAEVEIDPWPSDHRAVVVDLRVEAVELPPFVAAVLPRAAAGRPMPVRWRNSSEAGRLRVRRAGAEIREQALATESGTLALTLDAGRYDLLLEDANGRPVASASLAVVAADARPCVGLADAQPASGEPLRVRFRNAPGNRYDWIAIYAADASANDDYLAWRHAGARIDGTVTLTADNAAGPWPLPPGRYLARLLEDDGYRVLAESPPFSIAADRSE